MNESSTGSDMQQIAPEVQFAAVLKEYRLNGGNPFDLVQKFAAISADRALWIQKNSDETQTIDPDIAQELESYVLETKLWDLYSILQQFRSSWDEDSVQCHSYSSMSIKQRKYLQEHPNLRELVLITSWIQRNSDDISVPDKSSNAEKWINSKVALQNKQLASLTNTNTSDYIDNLDIDAPLRSSKFIKQEDEDVDSENYFYTYQLILNGKLQEAVDYATETGNFALALILVGAHQDYIDQLVDGDDLMAEEDDDVNPQQPSGLKHKYLWLQTVYKLAQEKRVNRYESLIYSFLSGADQSENVKAAGSNWDTCLLLYVNQLLTYQARTFLKEQLAQNNDEEQISTIVFPTPQHVSTMSILNTMEKSRNLSEESKNPFRVIMGSIIIDQLHLFLQNTAKSGAPAIIDDHHVLRVLAHLAVVITVLDLHQGSHAPTRIITKYVSKLSENGFDDLVPIYLSFIPDERDLRECYSVFLSTITDSEKRQKQLEAFKRLGINAPDPTANILGSEVDDEHELRFSNVLKRTVERVLVETEPHYRVEQDIVIRDQDADEVDVKLYKSVDWFYETKMYEDAIHSTLTVFRRFLTTGRIKAIKDFGNEKNIKALVKDYDLDFHKRSLGDGTAVTTVSEADKEELIEYSSLLDCLHLLDEWRSFVDSANDNSWKSKDVEKSIEKTVSKIRKFISSWFMDQIKFTGDEMLVQQYKDFRTAYIPYFIIELLQVLSQSRRHDWKYMREALLLVNEVANDKQNDFLECFVNCGRLNEFMSLTGRVSSEALEIGTKGIYV